MKILCIRGQNLASLDGEFLVDFTAPNFAQNGLIAIVGSTGSGKSTLLDALCLALFNKIPRLPTRGTKTLVGRADEDEKQRLASHDVRHILRRGTGEGYAEVDFLGVDNKKYRARWSVHRARKRPSDPFQKSDHRLTRLSDDLPMGRTVTDVRQAIENKLGLSFDQFRRSVLLAQGDFASFLKADVSTRSRLLEMITGTEIYGEISRQSHLRVKEESAKLQLLQTRLSEYNTLDTEERKQLEEDVAEQKAQRKIQQAELSRLQKQDAQQKQWVNLQVRAQQTQQAYEAQQQQWQETQASRDALQQTKQLQALRLPLQRFDDATLQLEKIQQQQQSNEEQLQTKQTTLATLSEEFEQQEARYQQSKNALQQAQPILREAYRLDEQIRVANQELQQQQTQQAAYQKDVSTLQQTTQDHKSQLDRSQKQSDALNTWLQQHQTDEKLSSQWSYWERLFDDLISNQKDQEKAQVQLLKLKQTIASNTIQQQQSQDAVEASNQQLVAHKQLLNTLNKQQIQADLDKNIADVQQLHEALNQLKTLEKQQQESIQNQQQQAALKQELDELTISLQNANKQKQHYQSELIVHDARLDEAMQIHKRALLATGQSAEQLRSQLSDGKPCSVCGSTEHPWHGNTQLQALADEQDKRVNELQLANDKLKKQLQQAESEIRFTTKQYDKHTENLALAKQQAKQIQQHWESLTKQPLEAFQAEQAIREKQNQLDQKQQAQKQLQQQRDHAEQISKEKDACLDLLKQQQSTLQSVERQQQKTVSDYEHLETQLTQWQTLEKVIKDDLAPAIQPIENSTANIETIKQQCQKSAEKYQLKQKQQDQLIQQIGTHEQNLAKQLITLQHAEDDRQKGEKTLQATQQQTESLQQSRCKLFSDYAGSRTQDIEQALTKTLEQNKANYDKAHQVQQRQKETVLSQETTLNNLKNRYTEQNQLLENYQKELRQALTSFDIDEAHAREHLVKDEQWIEKQEQKFQQIDKQLQSSQTLWETAKHTLQTHKKEMGELSTTETSEELQQQLEACQQAIKTTETQLSELQFRLRDDDNKRKQANKLQKDYDKQEQETHVWKVMKELIGSEDGSKFRNFAQSLTLEILLSHANQRLQELNRRYALQRIPQTDLELQIIDREMGDEVRPIHSLSGGESFLVSLGLALGLASLTSRKTQIDSLFIDEGFGTLDPQTLDTALSALDSLQSQGKTVCIISHVSAITERVAAQVHVKACGNGKSYVEAGVY